MFYHIPSEADPPAKTLDTRLFEKRGLLLIRTTIGEPALPDKNGNQAAVYRMNVSGEKEEGVTGIGGKQSNTVITTESSDMEAIFLGAFIMSRVEYSRYLL